MESHQVRKLQIGCGANLLDDWLNTDVNPTPRIIFLDATRRLPFANSTFNYVFCEHMIEHIEYQKAAQFVREVYRILRPGGKFRAAIPDLRFVIELYGEVKNDARQEYISWMFNQLHDFDVELDSVVINYLMRGFTPAHKFIYDFKTLKMLLVKNGFSDIISYGPGESDDEQLKGVEGHGRMVPRKFNDMETLVVECTKPELVT